ncbi:AMP-binding protein, partial [Acinetobacter baumannii]
MLALNSHHYLEAFFAVPWGGGIFTPLNFRLAVPELAAILRDAGAEILIVDPAHAHLVADLKAGASLREVVVLDDGYEALLAT